MSLSVAVRLALCFGLAMCSRSRYIDTQNIQRNCSHLLDRVNMHLIHRLPTHRYTSSIPLIFGRLRTILSWGRTHPKQAIPARAYKFCLRPSPMAGRILRFHLHIDMHLRQLSKVPAVPGRIHPCRSPSGIAISYVKMYYQSLSSCEEMYVSIFGLGASGWSIAALIRTLVIRSGYLMYPL